MLGTREAGHLREHGERRGRHDRSDAWRGLEPLEVPGEGALLGTQRMLEGGDLLPCTPPRGAVVLAEGPQVRLRRHGRQEFPPPHLRAQRTTQVPQAGGAEQPLDRVDLGRLQTHEVPAA